ncbi:asparaginase [Streptomyces sp. NPDC057638]|uniref:asparaginase n=1 Tax=Streptomyces sp. NPDC057638 TaxID=3346190 RepID=UPI0036794275
MNTPSSSPPPVLLLSLGGTIAMTRPASGADGVAPRLTGADLLAAVPETARHATLTAEDVSRLPGASLTVELVAQVADRLRRAEAGGMAGVVITQGTDSLEETAWLLDLLYDGPLPVVLTGAMRDPSRPGADGPAHLLAAVRTAASPLVRGLGPVVVLADEIHAARRVRKVHTTGVAAFASPGTGPIGWLSEGTPRLHTTPERTPAVPRPSDFTVRVEIVTTTLGGSTALLDGVRERLDGVVIAAFGGGHVPADWVGPLAELATRIPVVLASRTGAGAVLTHTYAYPGGERELLARGLVPAGTLDPLKARLLLLALLAGGGDRAAVRGAFAHYQ